MVLTVKKSELLKLAILFKEMICMTMEYVVVPAVAMTILPPLASKFETWRKGCYKEFTWPKHWAKIIYMSLAFFMIFINWRTSMAMYFGVVVYLLNCWIAHLKAGMAGDEAYKKDKLFCWMVIGYLTIVTLIYCSTEYGCIIVPFALIPYGFVLLFIEPDAHKYTTIVVDDESQLHRSNDGNPYYRYRYSNNPRLNYLYYLTEKH